MFQHKLFRCFAPRGARTYQIYTYSGASHLSGAWALQIYKYFGALGMNVKIRDDSCLPGTVTSGVIF